MKKFIEKNIGNIVNIYVCLSILCLSILVGIVLFFLSYDYNPDKDAISIEKKIWLKIENVRMSIEETENVLIEQKSFKKINQNQFDEKMKDLSMKKVDYKILLSYMTNYFKYKNHLNIMKNLLNKKWIK